MVSAQHFGGWKLFNGVLKDGAIFDVMCMLGCSVAGGGAEVGRRSQRGLPQPGAHSVHREDSQRYDEE